MLNPLSTTVNMDLITNIISGNSRLPPSAAKPNDYLVTNTRLHQQQSRRLSQMNPNTTYQTHQMNNFLNTENDQKRKFNLSHIHIN